MYVYDSLGAPEDFSQNAWADYLRAIRDSLNEQWARTKSAYSTLKQIREQFGLPFIADPVVTEGGLVPMLGAWTTPLQNEMVKLQSIVGVLNLAATDALDNKRQLGWDQTNTLVIEKLPQDPLSVQLVNNRPELVKNDGSIIQPTGELVGVGLPVPALIAIVGIATVGIYFTVEAVCDTIEKTAEEKTAQTLGQQQKALVESGKATPEQAAQMTSAIFKGRAEVKKAEAEVKKEEPTSQLASTARVLGFVALGIAGIYLASQVIGRTPSRSTAMARNPTGRRYPARRESMQEQLDVINEELALAEEELEAWHEGDEPAAERRRIEQEIEELEKDYERIRRALVTRAS